MLDDLLACARPQEPVFDAVDLNEIVRSTVTVLASKASTRSITIEPRLDPSILTIEADGKLLQQLLWNLLSNALSAEKEGGTISIVTVLQGSEPERSKASVLLTIRDTGRGMSPMELEQAFRPFYTTREGGSGLGLTLAKNIVDQHGGTIAIESVWGEGTTVHVTFSLARRRE